MARYFDQPRTWYVPSILSQIVVPIHRPAAALNTKYFDENGTVHSLTYVSDPDVAYSRLGSFKLGIPDETLESQIVTSGVVPADDIPGIVKFIQACLTLDPATRPSPDDLFRSEWVQPGLEG